MTTTKKTIMRPLGGVTVVNENRKGRRICRFGDVPEPCPVSREGMAMGGKTSRGLGPDQRWVDRPFVASAEYQAWGRA